MKGLIMYRKEQTVTISKCDNGWVVDWQDETRNRSSDFAMSTEPKAVTTGISIFKTVEEALEFARDIVT